MEQLRDSVRGVKNIVRKMTASVWPEDDMFVAQCLEIDIASQGYSPEEAVANLREAIELFFECATPKEIERRYRPELMIRDFDVA
jgi:predicted RNase H-like HicB family nuclease